MTRRNITDAQQHLDEDKTRLAELAEEIAAQAQQLEQAATALEAATERVTAAEQDVEGFQQQRMDAQQKMVDARNGASDARERAARAAREHSQLGSTRAVAHDPRRRALRAAPTRSRSGQDALEAERAEADAQRRQAEEQHAEARARAEAYESQVNDHDRRVAALGDRQAELTDALATLRHDRAARESRMHLLQEMHQAREGLGDAVKAVLEARDQYPGVEGLLADAIDTDRKHAAVVEAALGPWAEALLVTSRDSVRRLEPQLRELNGRLARIPLDREVPNAPALPATEPGWVTPLLSLIQVRDSARAAVDHLLRTTVVTWDLEAALMLAAGPFAGWRLVTRQGDVVEPDGRVTLGRGEQQQTADGWLSRRIELNDLGAGIASLDGRLGTLNADLDTLLASSAEAQQRQSELVESLQAARHAEVDAQYQAQRRTNELERIARELHGLTEERDELQTRGTQMQQDEQNARDGLSGARQRLTESSDAETRTQAELEQLQTGLERVQESLTAAKVESGQATEKLEAARREQRHMENANESLGVQREQSQHQVHRRLSQLEQYEAGVAHAETEMSDADTALETLGTRVRELDTKLEEASGGLEAGRITPARRASGELAHRPRLPRRRDQPPRGRDQAPRRSKSAASTTSTWT